MLEAEKLKCAMLREERDATICLLARAAFQDDDDVAWKAEVRDLTGDGYDYTKEKRTFQRHKKATLLALKTVAGDDVRKQAQLAEGLFRHFASPEDSAAARLRQDKEARSANRLKTVEGAIVAGVTELLKQLSARNDGRFTHADRVTHSVLLTAANYKAHELGINVKEIADALHVSRKTVYTGKRRVAGMPRDAYGEPLLSQAYDETETRCNQYPVEWAHFVSDL